MKKNTDLIIKCLLVVIIILLLIRNCKLLKENEEYQNTPGGNVDIIEIKCDNNKCRNLSFDQSIFSVKIDEAINLVGNMELFDLSSSDFIWKSSDPNIVTIDSDGVIRGIKVGIATITVTTPDGITAICTIEVLPDSVGIEDIVLTPSKASVIIGSTIRIKAKIQPENATERDLIWKSSNTSIATVSSNGIVKGLKSGTVTITATTKDGKITKSVTVTVIDEGTFEVYDDDNTPVTWNGSTDLKIFSKTSYPIEGKIAPESSNMYQFIVKNNTIYKLKYQINFIETNDYNINMKYKLKKNDEYIIDHYVSASELNINDIILNSNENDTYYLEWKWVSSSNDTEVGANPESYYGLKINIKAESKK